MAEKKDYYIRIKNELVPVTEDVYHSYYSMQEHERYLERKDKRNGRLLYSDLDTGDILGEEMLPDVEAKSVEQTVIDRLMAEELHECLQLLPKSERDLIVALFINGYSERQYAVKSGIARNTIQNRKRAILAKLKKLLKNQK